MHSTPRSERRDSKMGPDLSREVEERTHEREGDLTRPCANHLITFSVTCAGAKHRAQLQELSIPGAGYSSIITSQTLNPSLNQSKCQAFGQRSTLARWVSWTSSPATLQS